MRKGSHMYKRPMAVDVLDKVVEVTRAEYVCPSCKTHCRCGIDANVVRFTCIQCGRELIINYRKRSK